MEVRLEEQSLLERRRVDSRSCGVNRTLDLMRCGALPLRRWRIGSFWTTRPNWKVMTADVSCRRYWTLCPTWNAGCRKHWKSRNETFQPDRGCALAPRPLP